MEIPLAIWTESVHWSKQILKSRIDFSFTQFFARHVCVCPCVSLSHSIHIFITLASVSKKSLGSSCARPERVALSKEHERFDHSLQKAFCLQWRGWLPALFMLEHWKIPEVPHRFVRCPAHTRAQNSYALAFGALALAIGSENRA